jgi:hypothetical protein
MVGAGTKKFVQAGAGAAQKWTSSGTLPIDSAALLLICQKIKIITGFWRHV